MNDPEPIDAVRALRARGVDNGEDLLQFGTPVQILAVCSWWDSRTGVGPGLLARRIRDGEFPTVDEQPTRRAASKTEQLRARFDQYADRFPEGSVAEPHARLQARRWPDDDPCPGDMIVIEAAYPLLSMRCDACEFEAAIPLRSLHVLTSPDFEPEESAF